MNAPDRLYELLPAVYRERDAEEGYPLRGLLRLVNVQADILKADVQQLWDNFFIETCDRWAIPYIGDLVSNNLLHDTHRLPSPDTAHELFGDLVGRDLRPPIAIRSRADVAKTIYYRRRKGTVPMLEELARDVTGWPAHVVEFFELLGWTQYVRNHLRMHALRTPDIRAFDPMDRLNGAFDAACHTADVRAINPLNGWYNIKNLGVFVWRLRAYPLADVRARPAGNGWGFHFSPLGNPAPLFSRWRREGDEAGVATELHVPAPIRRAFFDDDLERYRNRSPERPPFTDLYGDFDGAAPDASFFIVRNGSGVPPSPDASAPVENFAPLVVCRRLADASGNWPATRPAGAVVAVDVASGRLAIGDGLADPTASLDVLYHYGFSADLGGGPYERGKWLLRSDLGALNLEVRQAGGAFTTIADALAEWVTQGRPNAIITIFDNRTYAEALQIELADDRWLVIQAANGARPHILPAGHEIAIHGTHPGSALTLSGLLIEGAIRVDGDLALLRILHTTLVPGRFLTEQGQPGTAEPSLVIEGSEAVNTTLRVQIAFSITGPLRLPEQAEEIWLLDSIVDGLGGAALAATGTSDAPVPPATFERVTVLGESHVKKLVLASETIFTRPVIARRRQEGCVRFSFVPAESRTPRRYRCQPDLETAVQIKTAEETAAQANAALSNLERDAIRARVRAWLTPAFTATRYGEPAYAQLHLACPRQIQVGAEDGSEMGAFCHLKQPQRETNLRIRLDEYLPFGLEAGLIYIT